MRVKEPTFELISNPTINFKDLRENGLKAVIHDTVTGEKMTVLEVVETFEKVLDAIDRG